MKNTNKAAIVTLFGNYNYGNKLQNYAVQEILREAGYQAETMIFYTSIIKECGRFVKRLINDLKRTPEMKRYKVFQKFNKEMLATKRVYAKDGNVNPDLRKKYAYFCVGSDQVWNPEIRQKERDIFFLKFAEKKQRICISPSIGVNRIEDTYFSQYQSGLVGFENLCCRETEGAVEISRVSGKECIQLIDPTMAVKAEKWREFSSSKPMNIEKKYILCFFLGGINPHLKASIEEYARMNNYEVYVPSSPDCPFYTCDPRQMVYLIDNSEMVFTDSFHFSAFSINLNKPFWVFDRASSETEANHINSRIITLVSLFGLIDRYRTSQQFDFSEKCDFSLSNKVIEDERNKFNCYIKNCIEK